jgi:hypothetical protein
LASGVGLKVDCQKLEKAMKAEATDGDDAAE